MSRFRRPLNGNRKECPLQCSIGKGHDASCLYMHHAILILGLPIRRKLGALRCSTPSSLRHSARATISRDYCTVVLTVAELLARLGSGVSSVAVAFSLITVPEGAVTFTIRRTVQVVFGAMALFS